MSIKDNLNTLLTNIPENVTLVAVSKTKSVEETKEVCDCCQRDFGENYVQELVSNAEQLPEDIRWAEGAQEEILTRNMKK